MSVAGEAVLQAGGPAAGRQVQRGAAALGLEKSVCLWKSCWAPFTRESGWYKSVRKGEFSLNIACLF